MTSTTRSASRLLSFTLRTMQQGFQTGAVEQSKKLSKASACGVFSPRMHRHSDSPPPPAPILRSRQTPRIWLVGYDESRMPLSAEKALEVWRLVSRPHPPVLPPRERPPSHAERMYRGFRKELGSGGMSSERERSGMDFSRRKLANSRSALYRSYARVCLCFSPLFPSLLQDISHEHARKTVTLDPHPHTGVNAASIHPCRHGALGSGL